MKAGLGPWFPVAPHKFIVLSVFSFGIYDFFWVYQNWRRAQQASGEDISPFWRTFLVVPIWIFPLLRRIERSNVATPERSNWKTDALGLAYVVFAFALLLPSAVGLVLAAGSFLPLVPAVRTIARVNAAAGNPEGVNDRYTIACVATIVVGGFIYAILIVATILGF